MLDPITAANRANAEKQQLHAMMKATINSYNQNAWAASRMHDAQVWSKRRRAVEQWRDDAPDTLMKRGEYTRKLNQLTKKINQ